MAIRDQAGADPMNAIPASVMDEEGNIHVLLPEPLGKGGQGVVLRTRSPGIAVKLVGEAGSATNAARQARLRQRLENLRLLPLPEWQLAVPLSMLKDRPGYTMRLLQGMVPIRSLIAPQGTAGTGAFYAAGGGLRRRLVVLAKLAALLARLHAVPLVYGDVSPNNVFVSESPDASELWLIDVDNLAYRSDAAGVFTPGFGAPELVTCQGGPSTLSDAYSFALLAYNVLAQSHPFIGTFVEDGGWDDDGEDREALADQGRLPWVEDPADTSNARVHGFPGHLVLTADLRELFDRAFGPGRAERSGRPSMAEWAEGLQRAAAYTVRCAGCGSTFYVSARYCPFCVASPEPKFIHMQVHRWDPEIDEEPGASRIASKPVWHKMVDLEAEVYRHVTEPVLAGADDPPVLSVRLVASGVAVAPLGGYLVHVARGGTLRRVERETIFPLPVPGRELCLHFGDVEAPHRMAILRLYGGVA
jgi:DNA-binding helix-hairpin-helix protein with protein kinase domain